MKKSEANIEDLRNQTVSWGTHRPDDLIPKFMAVLKEYGKEAYDKYVSENPEVEDWKKLDDETKGWVVDELFDLLDGIAPEDCYFGAHPGDGADFGFWQVDESKCKESKKSESDTADAEQVFKDMADSLGISDRSVITTDGDRVKFVLKLKLKDLEDYAWEYNPKLKVVKNIASPTADAFDGARKTVNAVEDAAAWLKGGIEELLNMEKDAIDLVGNESKKNEAKYDVPVTLYGSTRYDDAEEAQKFLDGISGGQVKVSKDRNGDMLIVSIAGSDEDIDAFLEVYKDNYDNFETDCDANVMGWTSPEDLPYLTVQGRKELTGESKKSEADGNKDIYILDLTRIDAEGDEEGLDDMQAAQNFYDEDEAIQAAKDLADSYKDDDDVVQVTVMAGEQEKPNGDIVGEPFDIFTASSSDSATTAKYREKANYIKTDGLDYYAKGGTSEAKKSMGRDQFIKDVLELADAEKQEYYRDGLVSFARGCYDHGETSVDKVLSDYFADTYEAKKSESKKNEDTLYMGCHGFFTKDGKTYVIEDESPEWDGEIVGKWSKSDWERLDTDKVIREWRKDHPTKSFGEAKKSESLTLKQKELKNMARYGEATDITTISDAEAKELKKKGIETVGISRGAYGMNGALLRDSEGNKYVITARSSNLFYFV